MHILQIQLMLDAIKAEHQHRHTNGPMIICTELNNIMHDSGRGFEEAVEDLFKKTFPHLYSEEE